MWLILSPMLFKPQLKYLNNNLKQNNAIFMSLNPTNTNQTMQCLKIEACNALILCAKRGHEAIKGGTGAEGGGRKLNRKTKIPWYHDHYFHISTVSFYI